MNVVTASSTLSTAPRLAPYAEKYRMTVAFHGHSDVTDPNQFAKPESFAKAMAMSKQFAVNLDIGHSAFEGPEEERSESQSALGRRRYAD